MKNKTLLSLFLTLTMGLFVFNSCTSKDEASQGDEKASVSFEFDGNTLVSNTKGIPSDGEVVPDPLACVKNDVPMKVQIVVKNNTSLAETTIDMPVTTFNNKYKTNPYELPAGSYTVMSVIVYNANTPAQIIYSGVKSPSDLALFVPQGFLMEEQTFTVEKWTKPVVPVYVLCVKDYNATDFGMPKFEINRIEVSCFDVFFNVCDQYKEHFVGAGRISVLSADGSQVIYSDTFASGDIATICFANNLEIQDKDESYQIKVEFDSPYEAYSFTQVITVTDLLKFQQWTGWSSTMNAVHVILCDPQARDKALFYGYPK